MKLAGTTAVTEMWAKIKAYIASATCNAANKLSAKRTISVTNFAVGSLSSDLSGDESLMLRRNMFVASGQNSSDVSNSWHKMANITNYYTQCDYDLTLTVLSAFVNAQTIRGQLNVHVRSYSTSAIGSASIQFLWASESVIPGRFRLLVKDNVAELWVNTPDRWADILFLYDYDVIAATNEYNLWSINSSSTASALPTDYAQYSAVIYDYPRSSQAVRDGKGNVIADTYSTKESTSTSVGLASNGSGSYNINYYNASGTRLFTLSNSDIITLLTTGSMPSNIKAYADVSGVALSNRCSRIALTSNGYSFYNESGSVMFNVTNSMLFSLAQSYINSNAGADFLVHAQSALHLKSSAWDWEGKGPRGTGTTVKKIATITGLGYVRLEGNNVIGTSMSRSNWRLDISAASSSVIANATTTTTVTFGYTYESGVLTLYLGERVGENTYNMFASEAMAGAAITWENSSVAAIAKPSGYISI